MFFFAQFVLATDIGLCCVGQVLKCFRRGLRTNAEPGTEFTELISSITLVSDALPCFQSVAFSCFQGGVPLEHDDAKLRFLDKEELRRGKSELRCSSASSSTALKAAGRDRGKAGEL